MYVRLPNGSFMQCTEEMLLARVVVLSTFTSTQYTCSDCSELNVISQSSLSLSLFVSVCVPKNMEYYKKKHRAPLTSHNMHKNVKHVHFYGALIGLQHKAISIQ